MDITRRLFIQTTAASGAFLLARFQGMPVWAAPELSSPCFLLPGSGFAPYLNDFLQHLQPGRDAFPTEQFAAELEVILETWRLTLCGEPPTLQPVEQCLAPMLEASALGEATLTPLRLHPPLVSEKAAYPAAKNTSRAAFAATLQANLAALGKIEVADLQIYGIQVVRETPLQLTTDVQYNLVGAPDRQHREQRTGVWQLSWDRTPEGRWMVTHWSASEEHRSRLTGPGFVDVTAACLPDNDQLRQGVDHWRSVLDGACGIDIYGNNGIAAGDFDGDGFDDLYICQPAGLPNRLYRNRGDGTFEDVTERAGVGVLDGTSSALFVDLNNNGHQDLIVVRTSGPLLYSNRGDGTFTLMPDAFHFSVPPQGTFTAVAAADYDRDGLLDVYFCLYSFYEGLSEYQYPQPYYDAQNGPPNFLLKNRGDYSFEDVTAAAGMNSSNHRFSFACSWRDFDNDGWPDLYVVNDFGRKVLYKNNRDGTFAEVSGDAGIEDPGEGMSMTWLDYDNDGRDDLYVVNMWEPAGLRVMSQSQFLPQTSADVRRVYRQDAMGNTLLHNEGDGRFRDVTEVSGTRPGGWNWGSDSWDVAHGGWPDLYVANGFISAPNKDNLSSFFWRQVVAHSQANQGTSQAYEDAWNAINEFVRSDHSWSGYQRNNCYLNNHNGSFTEAGGILGLDFLDDSRAFALADLNHDGRLEVILKNRTGPQVRVLQNQMSPLGASIVFSLRGTKSNRDAIGTVVELETPAGRQRKTVSAGSGFLMQHTKEVQFGLGDVAGAVRAVIHWPDGGKQALENLQVGHRVAVVEGLRDCTQTPFINARPMPAGAYRPVDQESSGDAGTWLVEPIRPPGFALPDQQGNRKSLSDCLGHPLALVFCRAGCARSEKHLQRLQGQWPEWSKHQLQLLAIYSDGKLPAATTHPFPELAADETTCAIYNIFHRYLFERRRDLVLPTTFLIDADGMVIKVYSGEAAHILEDWQSAPVGAEARLLRALPFPGHYLGKALHPNYFTYGVAFLRYGYPDQALLSFQQAIEKNPGYAAAYYNTGLIYLNQRKLADARRNLQKAVDLDPSNANVWNNLGVARGQAEDYAGAANAFQKALALDASHLLALENLSKLYKAQGRGADAYALLQAAVAAAPGQAELHLGLAMLLVDKDELASAQREFAIAVALQPGNVEALNGLGVVLMRMGKANEAIARFEQCRQLAPTYDRAYLNLALMFARAGDKARAQQILSEYPLSQHDSPAVRKALKEIEGLR